MKKNAKWIAVFLLLLLGVRGVLAGLLTQHNLQQCQNYGLAILALAGVSMMFLRRKRKVPRNMYAAVVGGVVCRSWEKYRINPFGHIKAQFIEKFFNLDNIYVTLKSRDGVFRAKVSVHQLETYCRLNPNVMGKFCYAVFLIRLRKWVADTLTEVSEQRTLKDIIAGVSCKQRMFYFHGFDIIWNGYAKYHEIKPV
jgi:hypothetical protein